MADLRYVGPPTPSGSTGLVPKSYVDAGLAGKQPAGSYAPASGIAPMAITGTAVVNNDPRNSDSRAPTGHASTHAAAGSDAITPASIGAAPSSAVPYALTARNSTTTNYPTPPTPNDTALAGANITPASAFTVATKCLISAGCAFTGGHNMWFRLYATVNGTPQRIWPGPLGSALNANDYASGGAGYGGGPLGSSYIWTLGDLPVTLPAGTSSFGVYWICQAAVTAITLTDAHITALFNVY